HCPLRQANPERSRPSRAASRAAESTLLAARARRAQHDCAGRCMTSMMSVTPYELPSWAQVTERRKGHIMRVTTMLDEWATALRTWAEGRRAWLDAGLFHDALKDAPDTELRALVGDVAYEPQMLHGPAAAARLEREGETRKGVLDAVRYHTIGYLDWDRTGRALYMAAFPQPARRFFK